MGFGMNLGQGISGIVSSVANIGAGWFADKQLAKGTAEAMQRQNDANALYKSNYNATAGDYKPYQQGGASAYDALLRSFGLGSGQNGQPDYSAFQDAPDYQFALQQGQQQLDRSAASRGRLFSGQQMQASQKFGQGLASQQLGNYRNGLNALVGTGMQANNALANYRMGYGNQLGQGYTNLGDLALARRLGRANINYKNVAAQDTIAGSMFGGGTATSGGSGGSPFGSFGGGQSSYGTTDYSQGMNMGSTTSSYSPSNWNSSNFNWGG